MPRHELTDDQWTPIEPLVPRNGHSGGQWDDHRPLVNGMVWRLKTGAPWRDVPPEFGPWQTVYERFNRWSEDGTLMGIAEVLLVELDNAGLVDWDLWCIDGTVTRASRAAAGASAASVGQEGGEFREPADHALGRSQGGYGTKVHFVCDGNAIPLGTDLTPGQRHESTRCEPLVQSVLDEWPDVLPALLAGDKAYAGKRIRSWLADLWIEPVIPRQTAERVPGDEADFDREAYRRRGLIECAIGWLEECRALATRFDKLAVNYMGTVRLAIILRYLRLLDSADRA